MTLNIFLGYLIPEILMVYIIIFFYKQVSLLKPEINLKTMLLLFLLTISAIFNNYYNLISLRFFTSILIVILIIKSVFKTNIKDAIYYTLFYSILSMAVELILTIILLLNMPNINVLNNSILAKGILSFIHTIIMYYLLLNEKVLSIIRKTKDLINIKKIFILIIIILDIVVVYRCYVLNNLIILILSIIISVFILLTIRVIINDKYNIKVLMDRNNILKNSYKAYANTIEECREFKHNIRNELYAVKGKLPKKDQEIINNIITKYNKNYEWITKIDEIPEGLQGIIYLKQAEAKQYKIQMIINTTKKINVMDDDYIDLCETIGILLDNAMEASKNLKLKVIDVTILSKQNQLCITIKNRFKNIVDVNKIGKKNYSTKEYKSGIGLNYIKNLNNIKIKVNFNIINDLFVAKISYNYKTNN